MRTWFDRLFGVKEGDTHEEVQALFAWGNGRLHLLDQGRPTASWAVGRFDTASLRNLRHDPGAVARGSPRLSLVFGDVAALLSDPANRHATFQVASQFNCLEFVGPDVTPEDGISGYESDRTQGPACSIACGPATLVRNYLLSMGPAGAELEGQRADQQINAADKLLQALNVSREDLHVRNGYMLASDTGLRAASDAIARSDRDELAELLKVGVHEDVQVPLVSLLAPFAAAKAMCSHIVNDMVTRSFKPASLLVLDYDICCNCLFGLLYLKRFDPVAGHLNALGHSFAR